MQTKISDITARHRTLFLSDLHLGGGFSRGDLILQFLKDNPAQTYMLVGDILDIWRPGPSAWGPVEQDIVDFLRAREQSGAQMAYVAGNHDPDPQSAPIGQRLPIAAQQETVHCTQNGRRFLVIHGHEQDHRLFKGERLTQVGIRLDDASRKFDEKIEFQARRARVSLARHALRLRQKHTVARTDTLQDTAWRQLAKHLRAGLDFSVQSLDRWLGHRSRPRHRTHLGFLTGVMSFGTSLFYYNGSHERRLRDLARSRGFDGVICGHFHRSKLETTDGILYGNCGDWLENFTALTEDFDGTLRLVSAVPAPAQPKALTGWRRGLGHMGIKA